MKTRLLICGLVAAVLGAAAVLPPRPVILEWDYPASCEIDAFYVRSSTNLLDPQPWAVVATVPGTNLTVQISIEPGQRFFVVTASNFWGESDPSPPARLPAVPQAGNKVTIRRGD